DAEYLNTRGKTRTAMKNASLAAPLILGVLWTSGRGGHWVLALGSVGKKSGHSRDLVYDPSGDAVLQLGSQQYHPAYGSVGNIDDGVRIIGQKGVVGSKMGRIQAQGVKVF